MKTPRTTCFYGRKITILVISLAAILSLVAEAGTVSPPAAYFPVFPGAMGFGAETSAGRGGALLKVTNLKDSGFGSLRAAVEAPGPRIIVFEVSGTITLSSYLRITKPYVTIAGQSAPPPGITIKGAGLSIQTHDVLVRHLRIRVGDSPSGPNPEDRDAFQLIGKYKKGRGLYNVVIDHVSASWAVDENGSTWFPLHDVTISNSIISEGLQKTSIRAEAHSAGMLIGDHSRNVAFIGNLLAHNNSRYPLIKGGVSAVVLNNLSYNCGWGWMYLDDTFKSGPSSVSAVGNVFIGGPNSDNNWSPIWVRKSMPTGTEIFLSDDRAFGKGFSGKLFRHDTSFDPRTTFPPVWHPALRVFDSKTVENRVLSNVGARPLDRDSVDERIVREVKRRTGHIIDSQREVGGWPEARRTYRPFKSPLHPNGDDDGDGYTNIEEVLNLMAVELEGRTGTDEYTRPHPLSAPLNPAPGD